MIEIKIYWASKKSERCVKRKEKEINQKTIAVDIESEKKIILISGEKYNNIFNK